MSTGLRILLTLASFVIVVAGMQAARPILVPLLFAAFLAIICAPALGWLIRHRVPSPLALPLVILGMGGAGAGMVLVIGSPVYDLLRPKQVQAKPASAPSRVAGDEETDTPDDVTQDQLDEFKAPLQQRLDEVIERLDELGIAVSDDIKQTSLNTDLIIDYLRKFLTGLTDLFGKGLFVLFYFVFMLLEASGFSRKLEAMPGDKSARSERFERIVTDIRRYVALKTMISLVTGTLIGVVLYLLDVPYYSLWALVAFLLNFVPAIGSIIAAIPPVILALVVRDTGTVVWVIVTYATVNLLVGNVIEPRVMGKGLGLSTLIVFLSLVFWGFILGPVGMLLSVPLTVIAKIILDASDETRWISILLSSEAPTVKEIHEVA